MRRLRGCSILVALIGSMLAPALSAGQVAPPDVTADPCPEPNNTVARACQLGRPNAMGTTIKGLFNAPEDVDIYRFEVPADGAQAHILLSDLWSEASLRLFDVRRGALVTDSDRQGQAMGQLRAPEVISIWLEAGSYAAFVLAGADSWEPAAAHSYTLTVALGPRPAAPAGGAPFPSADKGYQLTLSIEPADPGPFSLMTFTATVDPPFTDLFDFAWTVDGRPYGDNSAVVQVGHPPTGSHTVVVVARGARQYPDHSLPELPPNLSASGTFTAR